MPLFRRDKQPQVQGIGQALCGLTGEGGAVVSQMHHPAIPSQVVASMAAPSLAIFVAHNLAMAGAEAPFFRELAALAGDASAAKRKVLNPDGVRPQRTASKPADVIAVVAAKFFMVGGGSLQAEWTASDGFDLRAHGARAVAALLDTAGWDGAESTSLYALEAVASTYSEAGVDFSHPRVPIDMLGQVMAYAEGQAEIDRANQRFMTEFDDE